MATAFALKESYADLDFHAGVLARHDGTSLNVGELLAAGNGYILVDDPHDELLLGEYEPLKQASLSEAKAAAGGSDGLDKLNKDDLLGLAEASEVAVEESDTKRDLISKLREANVSAGEGSK